MHDSQHRLHSPYWIFLKAARRYSDAELLREFGLSGYLPTSWQADRPGLQMLTSGSRAVAFGDGGDWTCIADDGFYTLWHMPTTRPTLARLAKLCDVLAYALGDCDDSHDLIYYCDGKLVRHYVVFDSVGGGRKELRENLGEPLPGESLNLDYVDFQRGIEAVGQRLGFPVSPPIADLRLYTKPCER